jgi:hypothetical protein
MKIPTEILKSFQRRSQKSRPTGKTLSLLHLKKALREERYEVCPYWVARAVEYGAAKKEITNAICYPGRHLEEPFCYCGN